MTYSEEIQAYWLQFCKDTGTNPTITYGAFSFGDTEEMADELVQLVLDNKKTGTSSAYELYFLPDETDSIPHSGQLDIVLDGRQHPVGVIQNIGVEVLPFKEVSEEQARKEGEGDLSLGYWRRVHIEFWAPYYSSHNLSFSEDTPIVYEDFKLIYPN